MSPSVIGAPFPTCVKRSPHNNVPVVSSNMTPASHPCGTCGVSMYRRRLPPMSITSPLDNMRGGRSAISLIETRQPTIPCVSSAVGAAPRVSNGQGEALYDAREGTVSGHKYKIGQLVNYLGRERASGAYQVTQLLPPEGGSIPVSH